MTETYEDRIEARLHQLRCVGRELADAAAQRHTLIEAKKAVIATAMKTAENKGHTTAAAQEREAYASEEYQTWLRGSTEAVREYERKRLEWTILLRENDLDMDRRYQERAELKRY